MRRKKYFFALFFTLLGLYSSAALAFLPNERLEDPVIEARARALSKEIRCLVCAGQSIDDSNADLAQDLRRIVRERLQAGDTDPLIRTYLVERYGTYVLLKPPFSGPTALLWLSPLFFVLLGGLVFVHAWLRQRCDTPPIQPLSVDETEALNEALKK
jgi:cytochrome c-type biogenesis protein CcmH